MRYNTIKPNDVANGKGVVVSLWTQGCPHRCEGCHNPETWSFKGGKEYDPYETTKHILELLSKDNVHRNLSILGGEPLCKENIYGVFELCSIVKKELPDTKIFIWTGYLFEELIKDDFVANQLKNVDILVDGRFMQDKKDLSLNMRGSSNQKVINIQKTLKEGKIVLMEG